MRNSRFSKTIEDKIPEGLLKTLEEFKLVPGSVENQRALVNRVIAALKENGVLRTPFFPLRLSYAPTKKERLNIEYLNSLLYDSLELIHTRRTDKPELWMFKLVRYFSKSYSHVVSYDGSKPQQLNNSYEPLAKKTIHIRPEISA